MSVIIEMHEHSLIQTSVYGVMFKCTHVNVDGVPCDLITTGKWWPIGAASHMTTSEAVVARFTPKTMEAKGDGSPEG